MFNRRTFLAKTPAVAIAAALGLTLPELAPAVPYAWAGWGVRFEGVDGPGNFVDVWLTDPQGKKRWHAHGETWERVCDTRYCDALVDHMKRQYLTYGHLELRLKA